VGFEPKAGTLMYSTEAEHGDDHRGHSTAVQGRLRGPGRLRAGLYSSIGLRPSKIPVRVSVRYMLW
jgi:hypothetical protein